jgi:choline/glycine/proline betaine transport protein
VLGNFTTKFSNVDNDAPRWLRVFWAIAIGLLTIAMLMANGITALQSATVIMGLPFSFVMLLVMAGLYKSLRLEDYRKASRSLNAAPVVGNVDILNWKQRFHVSCIILVAMKHCVCSIMYVDLQCKPLLMN